MGNMKAGTRASSNQHRLCIEVMSMNWQTLMNKFGGSGDQQTGVPRGKTLMERVGDPGKRVSLILPVTVAGQLPELSTSSCKAYI